VKQHNGGAPTYPHLTKKTVIADLQNLAANGGGYYDQSTHMHPGGGGGYTTSHHQTHPGYYAPQQQPSYGPVYYPVSHGGEVGQHAAFDTRKRNYDALNDFFGDLKRNRIDASSYHQVGQRLVALQNIPIHGGAIPTDYISAGPSLVSVDGHGHGGGGGGGGGHHGHMPQHQYALPLPNLRTKNDLMNIDQFLEQMQATVYESSNAAAAAGIQQPGAHYTHSSINFRQSHSPPQTAINNLSHLNNHVSGAPMMATHSAQSTSSGTPALTPPSSSVSYTSGHSPVSSHGMSPTQRHSSTASAAYPSLPAVSMGYSSHSSTAPASTLGPSFDSDPRRRYSGGMLQRSANPPRSIDMMDVSDNSATPSPKDATPQPMTVRSEVSNNIDPALAGVSSPGAHSESGDSARDRAEEAWIENIRLIEALRKFISAKLERKEYEDDEDTSMGGTEEKTNTHKSSVNLYPTLRADDD
jgi:hypothetical protein